ncbi:MAG: DUF1566 domain-containing protein [Gammaproteobacteria bacterium]|nr:DUF1566 domain-containing protein [Gammaproteobacteria bacterium]
MSIAIPASFLLLACSPPPESASARFQKLAADGRVLELAQGPWSCVHDQVSGLVWETKHLNEDGHYHQATYSWFEAQSGSGMPDGGDCAADRDYYACDTQDAVDAARNERLCGLGDWRLPKADELASLLNRQAPPGEPLAHNALFPHLLKAPYWTADRRPGPHGLEAAVFHFGDGGTAWLPPSRAARLLLVRGPRGDRDAGGAAHTARLNPQP